MAWTEQLPNGLYRGFWRDDTGKRRSKSGFTQRAAALRHAAREEDKGRNGGVTTKGELTWGEWCDRWLELRRVEPSTKKADAGRIEHHLKPHWQNRKLARITRTDIQAWVNGLDDSDLSASTVRRIYYLLSASMKAAVKAGHLPANPCALIDLPTPAPGKEHYLTKPEFWSIHGFLNAPYSDAAVLLAYTGMRFGELAGLHWDRVDLERGTVTVVETWDRVDGKIKAYPKGQHARTIPLDSHVTDVLMTLKVGKGKCGWPHAKGSTCSSRLVLMSPTGLPLDYSTMREQHLLPALEMAGVGHTRLHDLRHSYASWLAQDGVPLHVVQRLLGHGDLTTTQRYAHHGDEQFGRVLEALR